MVVDLHGRLQAQCQVLVGVSCAFVFVNFGFHPVTVTNLSRPRYVIDFLFQCCHADAETVQLVGELRRQLVQHRLVHAGGVFRHGTGNHLRHLEAGNFLAAAIGAIAVALDHAVGGKLRHRVV